MIGDKKITVCADLFAQEAQGDIVTGETRACEAETTGEVLASDASVRADCVADDIDITARNRSQISARVLAKEIFMVT